MHIIRADNLPDTDRVFDLVSQSDVTDPFVTGYLGDSLIFRTSSVNNQLSPDWNEKFSIDVCHHATNLSIRVMDQEVLGTAFVGVTNVRVSDLQDGRVVDGWFNLHKSNFDPAGQIEMSLTFTPISYLGKYDPKYESMECASTYFPMRRNCRLTLYQDADTPQNGRQVT